MRQIEKSTKCPDGSCFDPSMSKVSYMIWRCCQPAILIEGQTKTNKQTIASYQTPVDIHDRQPIQQPSHPSSTCKNMNGRFNF